MVTHVKLPKLTWTMEEGLIGRWLKEEGNKVEKGEPICEIETEKTIDEIEAPEAGVLRKIIVPAGFSVPVNQTIAIIAEPDEEIPDINKIVEEARKIISKSSKLAAVTPKIEKPEVKFAEKRLVKISPLAKRLAKEHAVDITKIEGTGPGGRIVKEDILKAIEEAKAAPTPMVKEAKIIPLAGIRKTIAKRLSLSARTALHVPITTEVDMTETVKFSEAFRPEVEKRVHVRLSYTDILVKAAAKALEEHPIVNSVLEEDQIKIIDELNVGVAVAIKDGLIVPVIHNANEKSLFEIAASRKELVEKAREGKLSTRETSGGTFTISNLGMFGVDIFAPIINPPESAILGVGRIAKRPVVIDDRVTIRLTMTLSLVFDHRVMDGAQAAQFLQKLKSILENPNLLLT